VEAVAGWWVAKAWFGETAGTLGKELLSLKSLSCVEESGSSVFLQGAFFEAVHGESLDLVSREWAGFEAKKDALQVTMLNWKVK